MPLFLAVVALIVYASLYPWRFVFADAGNPLSILLHSWDGPFGRRFILDVAVNIALYIPLGITAWRAFHRMGARHWTAALALVTGALLSASIEMLQIYTPTRKCSGFDLVDNIGGTVLGIGMALTSGSIAGASLSRLIFSRAGDRAARGLLCIWAASLLFPLFPVTSLPQLRAEVFTFAHTAWWEPAKFMVAMMSWCAAGLAMAAAGVRQPLRSLALALLVIPLQFVILARVPSPAIAAGAVCGVALCFAVSRLAVAQQLFAVAFAGSLLALGLTPFLFTASNRFNWIPFIGILESGEWQAGALFLLGKMFLYSAAVWLLHHTGMRLRRATVAIAALLSGIEAAQQYIPGHVPEVTDPLLAIAAGFALQAAAKRETTNESRRTHTRHP